MPTRLPSTPPRSAEIPFVVGLTGGIGSGKSTVARMLADRGAAVIDVDRVGRDVIATGGRAVADVLAAFGPGIADDDGGVDRGALAKVVFGDADALARLTAISHPAINDELHDALARPYPADTVVVLDMAILVESNLGRGLYRRVVTVEAPLPLRLERAVQRGMPRADVEARMAAQADDATRRAVADAVVWNGGTLEELAEQVEVLWSDIERWRSES